MPVPAVFLTLKIPETKIGKELNMIKKQTHRFWPLLNATMAAKPDHTNPPLDRQLFSSTQKQFAEVSMSKKFCISITAACLLSLPVGLHAEVSLPNTFNSGEPAVADEVNQNFQALADAINNLDSSTGGDSSAPAVGASFNIPRGTGGAKYGVLLAEETSDGSAPVCWQARVFYENTQGDTITSASGTSVTPDNIYRTAKGCEGQAALEWDYTYGIPNSQLGSVNLFAVTDGAEIENRFDNGGGSFDYRIEQTIVTSRGVDTVYEVEIYENGAGEAEWITDRTHIRKPIGPLTVGAPNGGSQTFDNVATQSVYGAKRLVILAEGFGIVSTIDTGAVNFPTDPQFIGQGTTVIRGFAFARNADGEFGQLPAPFASGGAFSELFF